MVLNGLGGGCSKRRVQVAACGWLAAQKPVNTFTELTAPPAMGRDEKQSKAKQGQPASQGLGSQHETSLGKSKSKCRASQPKLGGTGGEKNN